MTLLKKYGPYAASSLILIALLLLFFPYVRSGYEGQYYSSGFYAVFNIRKSGLPSPNYGKPSVLLIISFCLSVISMVSLLFHKKDVIIPMLSGVLSLIASLIFYFAQLILKINLGGMMIAPTFVLYLIPSILLLASLISLYLGFLNIKEDRKTGPNQYSYIRKN